MEIKGRDLTTGLPSMIEINEKEIEEALKPLAMEIIKVVKTLRVMRIMIVMKIIRIMDMKLKLLKKKKMN